MSHLPELPVEVWQTILRHSMYVPDFLDPASFEGAQAFESWFKGDCPSRDDEGMYWEVERRRVVLRCVCQSWNTYCNLPQFQHRFVRMDDVWHQRISKESLRMATRIQFRRHECSCHEMRCPAHWRVGVRVLPLYEQYQRFCCEHIASVDCMRVKIADVMGMSLEKLMESDTLKSIKQAKILVAGSDTCESLTMLSRYIPNLCYLDASVSSIFGESATFNSSTLVSLSLTTMQGRGYTIPKWNLPSLRHFRIETGIYQPWFSVLIPLLQAVGSQLRSLHVGPKATKYGIPDAIWALCPLLERLHPGGELNAAPPLDHPIHTVSIQLESVHRSLLERSTSIIRWPNLQKVIVDGKWCQLLPEHRQYIWARWSGEWRSLGIALQDGSETSLDSYMEPTPQIGEWGVHSTPTPTV